MTAAPAGGDPVMPGGPARAGDLRRTGRRRPGRDDGAVPLEWALGVTVLLLPVVLLVSVFPTWSARKAMAQLAAQEATRAVLLHDAVPAARQRALAAVHTVAANHGLGESLGTVTVAIPDSDSDGLVDRTGTVTAVVDVAVPALQIPLLGAVGAFTISAAHDEPVDPYRSRILP